MDARSKFILTSFSLLLLMLFNGNLFSQERVRISYLPLQNSSVDSSGDIKAVTAGKVHMMAETMRNYSSLIETVVPEKEYISLPGKKYYRLAEMPHHNIYYSETLSPDSLFIYTDQTDTINGYYCKLAKRVIFSNTVDFWYAPALPLPATPYPSLGVLPGAVMKVVVNGSYGYEAVEAEEQKGGVALPEHWGKELSRGEYSARLAENHVRTISVFEEVQLSFGNPIKNPMATDTDSVYHFSKGTVALRKVKLPDLPDHTVFLKLIEKANGDAYDRTGSVFLIDPEKGQLSFLDALRDSVEVLPSFSDSEGRTYHGFRKTADYNPPVELLRFFTPFGVGHYNDKRTVKGLQWKDSVLYEQDVTSAIRAFAGKEVWIGAYIANYDKGGHIVSLSLDYHPESQERKEEQPEFFAENLFNTLNILEMSGQQYSRLFRNDTLCVKFDVPEGLSSLQLRYISTGHGGWGGGDEFNQKINRIFIDGKEVFSFIPWREDCSAFRSWNPASGNFWNGISSSDLSRSGWCPGGATNPEYINLEHLEPGHHTIEVVIPAGPPAGNSFSAWNVSGLLIGEF